jgi:hypothetical protein
MRPKQKPRSAKAMAKPDWIVREGSLSDFRLAIDAARFARERLGFVPDATQASLLQRSPRRCPAQLHAPVGQVHRHRRTRRA